LFVRQNRHRLRAEEVVVPDRQEAHQDRQVFFEGRGAEMLVHLVEAVQHGPKVLRSNGEHRRKADRRVHRIPAADPVPELEHVSGVDAEPWQPPKRLSKPRQNDGRPTFVAAETRD
jgi:hypothetical protein